MGRETLELGSAEMGESSCGGTGGAENLVKCAGLIWQT